jgi:hypothetical protein
MAQRCQRIGLLVVAAAMTFWGLNGGCRRSPAPPAGDVIAELGLPQLDGTIYDPAVLRGKKVLLNFWSPG